MIQAFYSGKAGLSANQLAVENIANNIANLNTAGFKNKTEVFSDLLYTSMSQPGTPGYTAEFAGSGAGVAALANDMTEGPLQTTGKALDYCPNGDGFFAVRDINGNVFYTRDGSFKPAQFAGGLYLADSRGLLVLDAQGMPIAVAAGRPQADPGIFAFPNSPGLMNAGNSLFVQTPASGAPQVSNEGFKTGVVEGSNVEIAEQMEHLIISQRGYQLNSRLVQTADEIASMTNELR